MRPYRVCSSMYILKISLLVYIVVLYFLYFLVYSGIQWYTVVYIGILTFLSSTVAAHTATSDNDEEC